MRAWEKNIRRVEPYVPGEQPKVDNVIKLNTNENPYPPAPKAYEAAKAFDMDKLRLYPDPECSALVHSIAQYYGMDDNEVFTGVGSDDVLAMCFLTFFNSEKPVLFPDISYSFYSVWADLYRIPYIRIPRPNTSQRPRSRWEQGPHWRYENRSRKKQNRSNTPAHR